VKNNIEIKSALPERSDGWIAIKVRSRLLVKAHVSATDTKVTAQDGVVTLTGTADSAAQKDLTGVYAQEIKGVKSVHNELVVKDAAGQARTMGEKIDDASITSQVKYALLTHEGTSALKTKITTFEGVIAISGEATSDAQKVLVTKLAQDVRGAVSVSNHMAVKG
jgi:osmotically-inducible protein OsmY